MLPFLLGLEGSEGASLRSEDTLNRRSPLDRCGNLTLRRVLDMMGKEGGLKGGLDGESEEGEERSYELM